MAEEDLRDFIKKYIGSLLEWDLVLNIYNNKKISTDKELAELFGYSESEIRTALAKLKSDGLIKVGPRGVSDSVLHSELDEKVSGFVDVLDHRHQRMTILTSVLQKEQL